jgi:hypothetical protein
MSAVSPEVKQELQQELQLAGFATVPKWDL